jgi:hypothetical protein
MKLLFFTNEFSHIKINDFLADTLRRSAEYPLSVIFTFKFAIRGLEDGQVLYMLRLDTTLFNFMPSCFFKSMFRKGLKKAGYTEKINWVKHKEVLCLLGGL